jgi:membrane-associated phospholipid phosphatase
MPQRVEPCFPLPPPTSDRYSLEGPQVQPDASYWHTPPCPTLCVVRPDDLPDECKPPPYPHDEDVLQDELDELKELKELRDKPCAEGNFNPPERRRLGLSPLLQLRPQPLGAEFHRLRPDPHPAHRSVSELDPITNATEPVVGEYGTGRFPVITTGRELARHFENETPGLQLRHALNALLPPSGEPPYHRPMAGTGQPYFTWSPPFQALVWAALDITIYSALLAAWFFKWRGGPGVGFRPRPIEIDPSLDVLYNRAVNDTQSGDGRLRQLPPPSPGTPRHPSYPSGHSTAYGAGAELLSAFFPDLRGQFDQLADNAGIARLWAAIHYRSDHLQGMELGRCVAREVIRQLQRSCICPPDPCDPPGDCDKPPTDAELEEGRQEMRRCCRRRPPHGHAADKEAHGEQEGQA